MLSTQSIQQQIKKLTVFCDLENGFAYATTDTFDNHFQACLEERKDKKGYKKEIKTKNCGHDWGICGDYNGQHATIDLKTFLKVARRSGIKVI